MLRADYEDIRVDLTDADLNGIQLARIQMRNLSLPGASMINASFISTDLTRSIISEEQLRLTSSYNMATMPNGSEALNASLIDSQDKCSLARWTIYPPQSISSIKQCYFIALKDNVIMTYRVPIYSYKRLFERQEAALYFRFQGRIENVQIEFRYQDQYSSEIIHRETGVIISNTTASNVKPFIQYEISAGYPSNAYTLDLQILLSAQDIYSDLQFYIQHLDFHQYRNY